ncbi:MAG: hypothetical protein QNJ42_12500 [Crocosphaera sp.]|nr:hypothetical protein [Crocosphaera sp.]
MEQILVDADIIVEYLLNRGDFRIEAQTIWTMIESQKFEGFITESGLEKVKFYISQLVSANDEIKIIKSLQKTLKTCSVNSYIIHEARTSHLRKFDAAINVVCATQMNLDGIVAWKPEDFESETSDIKIFSISQLSEQFSDPITF